MDKSNLLNRKGLSFMQQTDPRSLVERYLLAATMKDCSLMISVRLVDRGYSVGRSKENNYFNGENAEQLVHVACNTFHSQGVHLIV